MGEEFETELIGWGWYGWTDFLFGSWYGKGRGFCEQGS